MSELLRVEGLKVAVEGKEILKGLDLVINKGETHVIMGSNGAGKSTLFNTIMGNPKYVVTEGHIYFEGKEIEPVKAKALVKSGQLRKDFIKSALSSIAVFAVIPMQDIIGLGNEARMNTPSTTGANWAWRMQTGQLKTKAAEELKFLAALYGRNL